MPGREQARSELKKRLLADLDRARLSLARHSVRTQEQMSPAAIIERSFRKHRTAWLVGATVAGAAALRFILSPGSRKNERDNFAKSGTKGRLFRMLSGPLVAVGRKAAFDFATQYFKNHFKQPPQASGNEQDPI